MNTTRYPNVMTEEAEMLFEFLGLSLDEVADSVSEPLVCAGGGLPGRRVTDAMLMYTCLTHLFYTAHEADARKKISEYPSWVSELYNRATECELHDFSVFEGVPVIV